MHIWRTIAHGTVVCGMLFAFSAPFIAMAAGVPQVIPQIVPQDCTTKPGGCQSICDLAALGNNIINDAILLAIPIAAVLFAWSGAKLLLSGGDEHGMSMAKETLKNVLMGFLLVLASWLIVDTFLHILANPSNPLPWNKIC